MMIGFGHEQGIRLFSLGNIEAFVRNVKVKNGRDYSFQLFPVLGDVSTEIFRDVSLSVL